MYGNSFAKNIVIIAIMAAILITGKFMLSFIPNVEIVTPLIIIFTCVFGFKRVIFSVLIFCLADNILYSFFFLATIQYFFHWPLLCLLSELFFRLFKDNPLAFALLSVISGLLFWIETPVINWIFRFSLFLPTLVSGIPFMAIMTACGFIFIYLGFKPVYYVLLKAKEKALIK